MRLKFIYLLLTITASIIASNNSNTSEKRCPGYTYYIDSNNGLDANDGLSPYRPWKSLNHVNAHEFTPGDSILFKSGCEWTGQLRPKGSGSKDHPIVMESYGAGSFPKINQGKIAGIVLLLQNQDQWEISHLDLSGGLPKPTQQVGGIHVQATTVGRVLKHIVIRDCIIRNIYGSVKLYESSAIWVGVPGWNDKNGLTTSFDDVLIENNKIYHSDRCGILVWTTAGPGSKSNFQSGLIPSKNVIIRGNVIEDIGGDAILVLGSDQPLVEKNIVKRCCLKAGNPALGTDYNACAAAIWLHHCERGIMQYNAVYDCLKLDKNKDGMAYDFDFNCNASILQYNYSRNNAGGFLLIMPSATNNITRYNISENDRNRLLCLQGTRSDMNLVYNNTFYINSGASHIIPRAYISNNIFMAEGSATIEVRNPDEGVFKNNCYSGNWSALPSDQGKVVSDPQFINPGFGGYNAENLSCYNLNSTTPCKGKGIIIENNGGKDMNGTTISQSLPPDIGAFQAK